jgi:hypothetical protein
MSDQDDRGWWHAFCEWAVRHGINPRSLDDQRTLDAKSAFRAAFKMARETWRAAPYTEEYHAAEAKGYSEGKRVTEEAIAGWIRDLPDFARLDDVADAIERGGY